MKSGWYVLAVAIVALVALSQPPAGAQSEKTMSVAIGRITTFNPITAAGGYEYAVFRLIWGGVAVPTRDGAGSGLHPDPRARSTHREHLGGSDDDHRRRAGLRRGPRTVRNGNPADR
jgi:hypothetical protein